jgi:predicted peptidase
LKVKSFLLILICTLSGIAVCAQKDSLDKYYLKKEYEEGAGKMPYRILYPQNYNKNAKYPVILFLHGAGERGTDNEKQLIHGSGLFLEPEVRENYPAFVILPQCPEKDYWSAVDIDRQKMPLKLDFDYSKSPTNSFEQALKILKKEISENSIDIQRVYVMGLSMGGMGTFEMVYRNPAVFAAAIPLCGGGDFGKFDRKFRKFPFWVFHGTDDGVVEVKHSRRIVEKLINIKAKVRYTEYPGINHNSWDYAFREPDLFKWLFSQKRKRVKL